VFNYIIPQVATEVKSLLKKNERGRVAGTTLRAPKLIVSLILQ